MVIIVIVVFIFARIYGAPGWFGRSKVNLGPNNNLITEVEGKPMLLFVNGNPATIRSGGGVYDLRNHEIISSISSVAVEPLTSDLPYHIKVHFPYERLLVKDIPIEGDDIIQDVVYPGERLELHQRKLYIFK